MPNETEETYTTKDMCTDMAKDTVTIVAGTAAAFVILLAAGYTYTKVTEFRQARKEKKAAKTAS
jgi:uncharacterized protein (DUF2062 family)